MGRSPCCDENGLKKGPWTPEEDDKLVQYIQKHGHGSWRALPKLAGLNRCGKSCRLRWTNYLRPDIKRGNFSQEEEQTILHLHSILGNKWSAIASHLPGRTDNEIKNFWNTHLKKLIQMGFDPMTHQPRTDLVSTLPYLLALFNNMTDLMDPHHDQLAKLQYLNSLLQSTTSSLNTTNNSSFDQNGLFTTNMEAMNLLNSLANLKDSPDMNYQVMLNNNSNNNNNSAGSLFSHHHGTLLAAQPLHHHQNLLLSHMSNPPQVPFTSQSCLNNSDHRDQGQITNFTMISDKGDHNNTTPDHESSSILLPTSLPPLVGDATSSSSSYGGISSSHWNELFFEDTIMHDLS